MTSPATLLRELVAIPSVSSLSNRPVIEWLQRYFAELGWHSRVLGYADASGVEKLNLIVSPEALREGTVEAELTVVCHTDTVPYSAAWVEATQLIELDGMLHGCGACDVKGFLSCMLAAAALLKGSQLRKPLCMVFTSDEEVGCRGARFLLEQQALRPRYAIVGEPTSLVPSRAGKGYCLASVSLRGKAAHSAYPESGASAIFAAARLLQEIELLAEELKGLRNEAFDPPWTTVNVGEIHGGTAKNVVPAECTFLVEWRPIPGQEPELVAERLRQMIDRLMRHRFAAEGIAVELDVRRVDAGFETPLESPVIRAVSVQGGVSAQTIAFGTEAPWMVRMDAEAVVIGPGSMLTAHSPRECVPQSELDDCVQILLTAIESLCA